MAELPDMRSDVALVDGLGEVGRPGVAIGQLLVEAHLSPAEHDPVVMAIAMAISKAIRDETTTVARQPQRLVPKLGGDVHHLVDGLDPVAVEEEEDVVMMMLTCGLLPDPQILGVEAQIIAAETGVEVADELPELAAVGGVAEVKGELDVEPDEIRLAMGTEVILKEGCDPIHDLAVKGIGHANVRMDGVLVVGVADDIGRAHDVSFLLLLFTHACL